MIKICYTVMCLIISFFIISLFLYDIMKENVESQYIKENMTDAEAVKNGYVSISVLDYSLNSGNFIEEITQVLDE